ncbi:MAG TPA: DNRLRE domain-containing protein [Allosphingosinicella sp.]|nr:DNRLRE domain-containing protein [Allosphingosinicella sp.]
MRLLPLLAAVLAMLLTAAPAAAATYTLAPTQDTDVRENGGGTTNCGGCTTLTTRRHSTGEYRTLYQFSLASIPSNQRVVSATLRVYVTGAVNSTVSVHRVTQSWSESTLTWANSAGVSHDATAVATFVPASSGRYYDIDVTALVAQWRSDTAANNGVLTRLSSNNTLATFTSKEWATATQRPQLVIVTDPAPSLTTILSHPLVSDPLNGTVNPKAIPGSVLLYSLNVSNGSAGYPDSNSVVVVQSVPSQAALFVGNLGVPGSGPVAFAQGSPSSGLSYTYSGLSSTSDDLSFSNNGGVSFGYTPTADASGFDPAVTHIRINPKGVLAGASASGSPSFTLSYRVKVN